MTPNFLVGWFFGFVAGVCAATVFFMRRRNER